MEAIGRDLFTGGGDERQVELGLYGGGESRTAGYLRAGASLGEQFSSRRRQEIKPLLGNWSSHAHRTGPPHVGKGYHFAGGLAASCDCDARTIPQSMPAKTRRCTGVSVSALYTADFAHVSSDQPERAGS